MISDTSFNCKRFVLCVGSMDAGDAFVHKNEGSGTETRFLLVLSGGGLVNQMEVSAGLHDLSAHLGAPIQYVAGDAGCSWVAFNPLKDANAMRVETLASGDHVITPEVSCDVVTATGEITVNGTPIPKWKHARLFPGQQYSVSVPAGSEAALVFA